MKKKTGVLLINLGSPDNATVPAVYRYLTEFLNDPRVIDINAVGRFILVNLIIIPLRVFNSTKIYKKLWTDNGSPLIHYGKLLRDAVAKDFGDEVDIHLAMRYGKPSMDEALKQMEKEHYHKIILLPLFPQYASASTGSAIEKAMKLIRKWYVVPDIEIISQFFDNPGYIETVAERAKEHDIASFDHILFSYHGLPERQVDKVYEDRQCSNHDCESEINDENYYCYKATCFATTRMIAQKLGLAESQYTVCFQSRLDKNWLTPFADKVVIEKAKSGCKKLLVFSPAFVSDCLETTVEIGDEYQELFVEHGGEKIQLVSSLNLHPTWVKTVQEMIRERMA